MPDFPNPHIEFGTTVLDQTKCLQVAQWTGNTVTSQYWCNGAQNTITREGAHQLTFSIALDQDDLTSRSALLPALKDTAKFYPYGNTTGLPHYETTDAQIQTYVENADQGNFGTVDITMVWNKFTLAAVTP